MTESKDNTDRYINLAVVGHVSNGKTTLVNALTNVDTKRNSDEKKTGRTVKLGYANCILWQCKNCMAYASTGQSVKSMDCVECKDKSTETATTVRSTETATTVRPTETSTEQSTETSTADSSSIHSMELLHKISFVDAPGHHKYVQTMTRGATVVDGAIVVTDVRLDALQPQTIEHLAILSILDMNNIIVVQNKIDLVNNERRIKHYEDLRKELIGTAADLAAIIPISAQSKTNMSNLYPWLDELCKSAKNKNIVDKKVFSVIRSFDVNKPNTPVDKMKGGVLGGSVLGNTTFKLGDVIEIRPLGLITKIESIFSEADECKVLSTGGLYGIGTDLPGDNTKSDRLIGSLCGKSEDMPPIINKLNLIVSYVTLDPTSENKKVKLQDNTEYQLMLGNITISGVAHKISGKNWTFELHSPICTVDTTCLIYTKQSELIAFGRLPDYKKEEKSTYEIKKQTQIDYESTLPETELDDMSDKKKTSVPVPKLAREGRNVLWLNINSFSNCVHRDVKDIVKYLVNETMIPMSLCDNGLRMYKAAINESKLTSLLKKYIITYVTCKQCKSINTDVDHCLDCNATHRLID